MTEQHLDRNVRQDLSIAVGHVERALRVPVVNLDQPGGPASARPQQVDDVGVRQSLERRPTSSRSSRPHPIANLGRVLLLHGQPAFHRSCDEQDSQIHDLGAGRNGTDFGALGRVRRHEQFRCRGSTPGRTTFLGGLHDSGGGTSTSSNTCYLAPLELVALDKTSTIDYDYWLVVGSIDQIRQQVYELNRWTPTPAPGFRSGNAQFWNFNAYGDLGDGPRTTTSRPGR